VGIIVESTDPGRHAC